MDEQLDVVVVAKVSRPMREWLRHKAYIEERTMSSIIRDMLAQAQREERAEGGHDGRKVVGPAETETRLLEMHKCEPDAATRAAGHDHWAGEVH